MQISGLHIDGFGLYHHQGVQDLPGGLILFTGENESGKTTLMEFIRTVLFGFPRKGTRNDYPPLAGGNHGGRLQVLMQDGRLVTVERLGRQATLAEAGGATLKAEPGEHLLGGLDRTTFERVFAVGLQDLNGLDILSLDGVRHRLFAAGAGLGSASVPETMAVIDRELAALLLPGGKKQIIYGFLHRLQGIDVRISELRGLAASYARAQGRKEQLEEDIRQNRIEAEARRRRLRRLEQLEQAREPWVVWLTAGDKARELDFVRNFPVSGLARLTQLKVEMDELRRQQVERDDEAGRLAGQLAGIAPDEALLQGREAIEALLGEREKLASKLEELAEAQVAAARAADEFQRRLRELGPDWDPDRLAQVDSSLPVRHQVQEIGRAFAASERRLDEARARVAAAHEAAGEAERLAAEAEALLQRLPQPPVAAEEPLQEKQEAVRRLRQLLQRREVAAARLADGVRAREEAAARLDSLARQMTEKGAPLPRWVGIPFLIMGLTLGSLAFQQKFYVVAGISLGGGILLAALSFWWSRRQARSEGLRQVNLAADLERTEQAGVELAREIAGLENLVAEIDVGLDKAARGAGLQRPADLVQMEADAAALEDAAAALRQWRAREAEAGKARDAAGEARLKLEKVNQEAVQAQEEMTGQERAWQEWLARRDFSREVRPEGFEAIWQAVETARQAGKSREDQHRRLAAVEDYLQAMESRLQTVLESCGRPHAPGVPRVEDLDELRRALTEALDLKGRQTDGQNKWAAARQGVSQIEGQLGRKAAELQELLQKAGAGDEEDFRRRAAAFEQWQEARRQLEASELILLTIAGKPEDLAALEAELQRSEALQLQAEKGDLEQRLAALTAAMDAANREVGNLNRDLDEMTRNEELGQLLLEQRIVREQLAEAVRRWAALAVCRHLLEQTRAVYERERQPQVIQEADHYLGAMAGARYRLLATLGEASLRLENCASLKHTGEVAWSAGLADQVYLAIRLGLAREFGRHSEPLPVILDDVLVKFDPTRRRQAARVILEFSREQQVLMFSCHPEYQEIFEKLRQDQGLSPQAVARFTIANGVIYPIPA